MIKDDFDENKMSKNALISANGRFFNQKTIIF